jgi:hypothetical protein
VTDVQTDGVVRKRDSSLWKREADDWYVEPEWCSRRLFAAEKFEGGIWDPACGGGTIVRSALAAGMQESIGSDLVDRGWTDQLTGDFLDYEPDGFAPPNIASNPPFKIAERFVAKALEIAERKVAMLLPSKWIQGQKRSRWLKATPLYRVYFICPRPSMPPGHVIAAGEKPGNGTTDFAWFVWLRGYEGDPTVQWLYREDQPSSKGE